MASYTEKQKTKIINDICKGIESGLSLRAVIQSVKISSKTFYEWIDADEAKVKQYTHARDQRHNYIFEEILTISDNESGDTQRDRLRVDSRKWMLGKMDSKKYGEKLDITSDNEKLNPQLSEEEFELRLLTAQKILDNKNTDE